MENDFIHIQKFELISEELLVLEINRRNQILIDYNNVNLLF